MKTHNTTTTPRDRVIAAIVNAADAPAARRAIGELVILEPDASIRVRISRLGADVGRKLDHLNHVQFIDHRGALALSRGEAAREALEAFGLEEPWGEAPRIVWDPYTGAGRPRTSDRRSPADEALSDLIADKVAERMPRPGVPTFTVNVAPLAAAEVERAVAAALEKALPEKARRGALEELNKWKARAGANGARAERLAAIVGAWRATSQKTREYVGEWDTGLALALREAEVADRWGTTEAEVQADAATATERREAAAETPKDGPLGRKVREALQREQGVTFKREDLEALQKLLAVYSAPDRAQARGDLARSWNGLDHALEGLADAYKRATK